MNTKDPYIIRKEGEIIQKGDDVTDNPEIGDFDPIPQQHNASRTWEKASGWIDYEVGSTNVSRYPIRARYPNPNYRKEPPIPPTKPNDEANVEIYL